MRSWRRRPRPSTASPPTTPSYPTSPASAYDQYGGCFYYAEDYHQQYLAKPGSHPYCSAMPTQAELKEFEGNNYRLPSTVWAAYDWTINHCVLRSDNAPIRLA